MPFKSKAQQRFMYANKDKLKKQGVDVEEWSSKTDYTKLPEKAATALGKFAAQAPKNFSAKEYFDTL